MLAVIVVTVIHLVWVAVKGKELKFGKLLGVGVRLDSEGFFKISKFAVAFDVAFYGFFFLSGIKSKKLSSNLPTKPRRSMCTALA